MFCLSIDPRFQDKNGKPDLTYARSVTLHPTLFDLCRDKIMVDDSFKADDDDIKLLKNLELQKPLNFQHTRVFNIWDATNPLRLKIRFVAKRQFLNPMTSTNLIHVSRIIGNEATKYIYGWQNAKFMREFSFSQRRFWRLQFLKLEGSRFWFDLFWEIYRDCLFDDGTPSFANFRRSRHYFMTIDMTRDWYRTLNSMNFFSFTKMTFAEKNVFVQDLLRCGDVEANPGPVCSKPIVRNNSPRTIRHKAQGPMEHLASITELNAFLKNQLPQVLDQITQLVQNTNVDIAGQTTFVANELRSDINLIKEHSTDVLNHLDQIKSKVMKVTLLVVIIILLSKMNWNKAALITAVTTLLFLFGVPQKLISMFEVSAEKKEEEISGFSLSMVPFFGSLILYFIVGKLPKDSTIENFSKKMNNISRGLHGAITVQDDLSKVWDNVKKFVNVHVCDVDDKFLSIEQEMKIWADDIARYSDMIERKKAILKASEVIKISELYKQGIKFKNWAHESKQDNKMIQYIVQLTRHAELLFQFADKNNALDGGMRQRPLSIVLFGESQIGKSTMIYLLAQDLLYKAGYQKASDLDEQIYSRMTETEFWDGYHGQFCVIRDDALASKDDVSKPNLELHETIREMNDFPYHLHMAALEDKNTYYNSRVGIMTVNNIRTPILSLSYPEAFYNRISDNLYEVIPAEWCRKTESTNGGPDKVMLDMAIVENELDELSKAAGKEIPVCEDVYLFQKYIKVHNNGKIEFKKADESPIDFATFSKRMCSKLERNSKKFDVRKEFFEDRLAKKMQEQVGSDEVFEDALEFDYDFADIIAQGIYVGKTLTEIEVDIIDSDKIGMWDAYCSWKNTASKPRILNNTRQKLDELIDMFKERVSYVFDLVKKKYQESLKKYPALKYLYLLGGAAITFWGLFKIFGPKPPRDYFVADDVIDEETYQENLTWIGKNSKLTFEQRMNYVQQNLIARFPEEKQTITENTWKKHDPEGFTYYDKDGNVIRVVGRIKRHKPNVQHKPESLADENSMETAMSLMRNNMYHLTCFHNGKELVLGNVIIVKGIIVMMPHHFVTYLKFSKLPLTTKLNLSRKNSKDRTQDNVISFTLGELIDKDGNLTQRAYKMTEEDNEEIDCVLFGLSENSNIYLHRSVINHFIKKEDLSRLNGKMDGMLISYRNDGDGLCKVIKSLNDIECYEQNVEIESLDGSITTQKRGFLYHGQTTKGDCGGALFIESKYRPRKLLGFHVSGSVKEGYSIRLTQEMINNAIAKLQEQNPDDHRFQCALIIPNELLKNGECDAPEGVFGEIGTAKFPLHQSSRTVLSPSSIHGQISEPITKPAILRPTKIKGKIVDPLRKGLEKCGGRTELLDPDILNRVTNIVQHDIHTNYTNLDIKKYARVLTYKESIQGAEDSFITPICRTTSPGYPYNTMPIYRNNMAGKQFWTGKDEFDFTSEAALELRGWVEKLKSDCLKGDITGVINADTLKDERRPIPKVDEGKTRVFAGCPLPLVVLFRQYTLGFASFMMHNRNRNGSAVGTNVFGEDWNQIQRKIQKVGKKVLAGDFGNFDGSLITSIMWKVFHIIDNWYKRFDPNYSEDDRKIRASLWFHIVNSVHIFGDTIIQWTHSQPSGNPFTVMINVLYNLIVILYAYFTIIEKSTLSRTQKIMCTSYAYIRTNISMIAYGDDNIINVSDDLIEIFNQETLTQALADIGHTYTEESKDGKIHKFRLINEITFLKRAFVYDTDFMKWTAPLDKTVIYEMINWVRKNTVDSNFLLKMNIETALREISLHGKEEYDKFVTKLKENKIVSTIVQPYLPTFEETRLNVENMGDDFDMDRDSCELEWSDKFVL